MIKLKRDWDDDYSQPWILGSVPYGYWDLRKNRVAYLRWLGERMGFVTTNDWYEITRQHFKDNYGGGLLAIAYKDSPLIAMRDFKPKHDWIPWLFKRTPQRFWAEIGNRDAYMCWLEKKLGIKHKRDWYHVTKKAFSENGGLGLLHNYYDSSVAIAVREYAPRFKLEPWRFDTVPQGFWHSADNCRTYMQWLGKQLKITSLEQWYDVTSKDLQRFHGITLLTMNGSSIYRLVQAYLPPFDWKPWLFRSAPNCFWQSLENRRAYLVWLGNELGFQTDEDWYQLTHDHFRANHGSGLFAGYYRNSLVRAARERYPDCNWDAKRFQYHVKLLLSKRIRQSQVNQKDGSTTMFNQT